MTVEKRRSEPLGHAADLQYKVVLANHEFFCVCYR